MTAIETRELNGRRFARVCHAVQAPDAGIAIELDDTHDVAVFRIDGTWYGVSNVCPHKRLHVLCKGLISDHTVQCPMHGWRFDIKTGRNLNTGASLRSYTVVDLDGWIWVEWPEETVPSWAKGL